LVEEDFLPRTFKLCPVLANGMVVLYTSGNPITRPMLDILAIRVLSGYVTVLVLGLRVLD